MNPGKILLGQVCVVVFVIVLMIWFATQWTADAFGYQPALGRPWFFLGEWPVYLPWRLFQWWYAYEAYAPGVFAKAGLTNVLSRIADHPINRVAELAPWKFRN